MAITPFSAIRPRQRAVPFGMVLRIAVESIRMRLGRSLIATGGIVLGVAFLASVMVTDVSVRGMRQWAAGLNSSAQFAMLRQEQQELQRPSGDKTGGSDTSAQLVEVNRRLDERMQIESLLKAHGVPVTAGEITDASIQTRWLLGLGLLVAFIGILNAMLMSVTERFREIGTMKCLGALDGFIVRLFLVESLFQGVAGTVVGIVLGGGLSLIAQSWMYGAFAWKNALVASLAESFGWCFVVGLLLTIAAAIYPAWKATRMGPIAAMRVEV